MNRKIISEQKAAIRFMLEQDMLDKIVPSPGKAGCVGMFSMETSGAYCIADLNLGSWSLTILEYASPEEAVAEYWQLQKRAQCNEDSMRLAVLPRPERALN